MKEKGKIVVEEEKHALRQIGKGMLYEGRKKDKDRVKNEREKNAGRA